MVVSREPSLVACITHAFCFFQRAIADLGLDQLEVRFNVLIVCHVISFCGGAGGGGGSAGVLCGE